MIEAKVSCVIPVYNGEKYVGEAIDSVLSQTVQPLELIVVDDGSTDRTPDIVRSFGDRLTYIRQDNAGPAKARNRGISVSHGEYLSFLDADDLWVPDKTQRQLEVFRVDESLEYCIGGMENFTSTQLGESFREPEGSRVKGVIDGYTPITLLVRRSFLERVGPFDPRFAETEDWEWFVRAHDLGGKCHVIDTCRSPPDPLGEPDRWKSAGTTQSLAARSVCLSETPKGSIFRWDLPDGG